VTLAATSSMSNLVETINRDVEGVTASVGDRGQLLLTNDTGEDIEVGGSQAGSGIGDDVYHGYIALDSADDSAIEVSGTPAAAGFLVSNGADAITSGAATFSDITADDKLEINGISIEGDAADATETAALINSYSDETGVSATITGTTITFSAEAGKGIEISSSAAEQGDRTAALTKLGMQSEMGGKVVDSLGTNVSTMSGAMSTIDKVDAALEQISSSRAGLGAIQNRLESTISNLENVSQNLSASNSRIQDADFAAETSKMSKAQILQQAGTSMLSQANASAQSVLSLLG
jgi:flagellin